MSDSISLNELRQQREIARKLFLELKEKYELEQAHLKTCQDQVREAQEDVRKAHYAVISLADFILRELRGLTPLEALLSRTAELQEKEAAYAAANRALAIAYNRAAIDLREAQREYDSLDYLVRQLEKIGWLGFRPTRR